MKEQNEFNLQESANARQVGGSHYKKDLIEHWDTVALFNLDYFQGNIWKYVLRWRHKNGLQDLDKASHYLQKYKEVEAARANGTLTRSILERAILELEDIEQAQDEAAKLRAQNDGDFPVDDVLSGYKFKIMPEEKPTPDRSGCTHGAADCPVHPNGGCPAGGKLRKLPDSSAALPAGQAGHPNDSWPAGNGL